MISCMMGRQQTCTDGHFNVLPNVSFKSDDKPEAIQTRACSASKLEHTVILKVFTIPRLGI